MPASAWVTNEEIDVAHSCGSTLWYAQHLFFDVTLFERKCQERLDVTPPGLRASRFFLPRDHSEPGARYDGSALRAPPSQTLRNPSCCGPVAMW